MTANSIRRTHSPHAAKRRDARTAIYTALYGKGAKNGSNTPAFDQSRRHLNPEQVSWGAVRTTMLAYWVMAQFDFITGNKLIADFNHYAKGAVNVTREELEAQS